MARLEIELAFTGENKIKSGLSGVASGLSSMQAALDKANSNLAKASASTLELEGDLVKLNKQLASGVISGDAFAREQKEITTALSSSRQAVQGYQSEIKSINATLSRGVTSTDNYGNSVKKLAGYHSDFSKGIRGASGVSLEFARIIQDAPYGIVGVGNNIQQLTSNYAIYAKNLRESLATQGQTISSFGIFKSALGSLITPMSLLTLGVAAVTTGLTLYTQWQQKSAKETKKNGDATKAYVETLSDLSRMQLEGIQNSQKDLTNLRLLYNAYQNANLPLKQRKEAYKQIQNEYPEYFKNIKFEQTASNDTKVAYDSLTQSIIATSRARAGADLITKNATRQLEDEAKMRDLQIQKNKELAASEKIIANAGTDPGSALFVAKERIRLTENQAKLDKQIRDLATDREKLSKRNLDIEKSVTDQIAKGAKILNSGTKSANTGRKVTDRSDSIVNRSNASESLFGLEGVDKEVESVRQEYIKLYADLSANAKKSTDARKTYESDYATLQANEASKISTIIISERQRVANEIERINDTAGIKAAQSIEKELLSINRRYDEEILKAKDSSEILSTLENAKQTEIEGVYSKYDAKRIEDQQKVFDKINDITEKGFTDNIRQTAQGNARIDAQLKERLAKITRYYQDLAKLNGNSGLSGLATEASELIIKKIVIDNAAIAKNPAAEIAKQQLKDAANSFGQNFSNTLRNLNSETDRSFRGLVGTIGDSLNDELNSVFNVQLKKTLNNLVETNKISTQDALTAIGGLVGNLITGITKKSSTIGQATGGALTGAAAGASLGADLVPIGGGLVGGIIGGVAGLIGGIFGSSKAKKQEALQKAQLEEAKKQTKLQEIQAALAYSSSIIGQQTNQGIVTGIERNEFGDLVTKVSGSDLLVVLDRTTKNRNRGV